MAIRFTKDPDAILDYTLDWTQWLVSGDTITSATSTPDTGIDVNSTTNTTTETTTWMAGGTAGQTYNVVVHVVTADGREDDRTMTFVVKER